MISLDLMKSSEVRIAGDRSKWGSFFKIFSQLFSIHTVEKDKEDLLNAKSVLLSLKLKAKAPYENAFCFHKNNFNSYFFGSK